MDNVTEPTMDNVTGPSNTTMVSTHDPGMNETSRLVSVIQLVLATEWAWVIVYFLPVIVIMGMVGNSLTFVTIIYRGLHRKKAMYVFMAGITANDLVFNVSNGLITVVEAWTGWSPSLSNQALCSSRVYTYVTSSVTSAWLLVFVNVFKLYVIAFPLDVFKRDSLKASWVISVTITVVMYAGYTHLFWFTGLEAIPLPDGTTQIECYVLYDTKPWYATVFMPILDLVVYTALPGIILVITSIAMIILFMRSYNIHKTLMSSTTQLPHVSLTYRSTKNTVLMLLPVSILFILTTLPIIISNYYLTTTYGDINPSVMYTLLATMLDMNHSLNPYLQLAISSGFRNAMLGRQ